jgi:predicted dehydrogenase
MKVALIGYGVIGKVHHKVIESLNVEVVGICDIDLDKVVSIEKDIVFTDYKKMLDITSPDIVHICTPHYLHKEMIIYALGRNINVLCEKPICITKEEMDEIEIVLSSSTAQLGICYQNRYEPAMFFVKDYLKDKKVVSVNGLLMWHRDANYYAQANWRGTKKYEGGGVLINQAIHTLDLMQYFSSLPEEIVSYTDNISLKNIIEVEDTAVINSTDGSFTLTASNAASRDFPVKITIRTEDEIIEIYQNNVIINGESFNCKTLKEIPGAKKIYGGGHSSLINDFYDCISNNEKFEIDFHEAIKSLKIVLAAYRSFGKKIKI